MAAGVDDELLRVGAALRHLVRASYTLHPDAVPAVVADAAAHLGGRDVVLLIADLDQEAMRPLHGPGDETPPGLPIDGTVAGAAFRSLEPTTEPAPGGGRQVWAPILDSADRLGVLGLVDDGEVPLDSWMDVAGLLGELLVSKAQYGDSIAFTQRVTPMSIAAELRWGLLPPLQFVSPSVTIAGIVHPPHQIAGDAFDYAVTGRTASIAVFDAMGHGLEAARLANLAVGAYRNIRRRAGTLADALHAADDIVSSEFAEACFVTAQLADVDLDTGLLRVLNAGHPPPLLLRDGKAEILACPPTRPLGLGVDPPAPFEVDLQPDDVVLFHTDGVTEARAADGEQFGEVRLGETVLELCGHGLPLPEVLRETVKVVLEHTHGPPTDDATLVGVSWCPEPRSRVERHAEGSRS